MMKCIEMACILSLAALVASQESYPYGLTLLGSPDDPDLYMRWSVNDTDVSVELQAKSKGWMAMGRSPDGQMDKSDVLFAWTDLNGRTYVQDRFIVADSRRFVNLTLDQVQDWRLVGGMQNSTHTVIRASRKLVTPDARDYNFTGSAFNLIYSVSDAPPNRNTGEIKMHFARGSQLFTFQPPTTDSTVDLSTTTTTTTATSITTTPTTTVTTVSNPPQPTADVPSLSLQDIQSSSTSATIFVSQPPETTPSEAALDTTQMATTTTAAAPMTRRIMFTTVPTTATSSTTPQSTTSIASPISSALSTLIPSSLILTPTTTPRYYVWRPAVTYVPFLTPSELASPYQPAVPLLVRQPTNPTDSTYFPANGDGGLLPYEHPITSSRVPGSETIDTAVINPYMYYQGSGYGNTFTSPVPNFYNWRPDYSRNEPFRGTVAPGSVIVVGAPVIDDTWTMDYPPAPRATAARTTVTQAHFTSLHPVTTRFTPVRTTNHPVEFSRIQTEPTRTPQPQTTSASQTTATPVPVRTTALSTVGPGNPSPPLSNILSLSISGFNLTANFFGLPFVFNQSDSRLKSPTASLANDSTLAAQVLAALTQVWSIMGSLVNAGTVTANMTITG